MIVGTYYSYYCLAAILIVSVLSVTSKPVTEQEQTGGGSGGERQELLSLIDDDGTLDTALINYLFARQMMRRLQNNGDITDLQRKRNYWKQCAFNAVSCFGRRK